MRLIDIGDGVASIEQEELSTYIDKQSASKSSDVMNPTLTSLFSQNLESSPEKKQMTNPSLKVYIHRRGKRHAPEKQTKDIYKYIARRRGEISRAVVNRLVVVVNWTMDVAPDLLVVAACEP